MNRRRSLPLVLAALLLPTIAHATVIAGPDAGGYQAETSTYTWVPLASTAGATAVGITSDDLEVTVTLPFTFPFYGVNYTQVRVGDNGGLFMGPAGNLIYSNVALPSASGPDIAIYWDDLRSDLGVVRSYHDAANARFIISWEGVGHYYLTSGFASFQVHLHTNGNIKFVYNDTVFGSTSYDNGISATTGIQALTPGGSTAGKVVQLSYNTTVYPISGTGYLFSSCTDTDGDGFQPVSCGGTDCNDGSATVYPGAPEICGDGIDQNCLGGDLLADVDSDGFPSLVCGGTDCDDGSALINPGVDSDGDGFNACLDCNDGSAAVNPNVDGDGDGSDVCEDCDDGDNTSFPGATELCDGDDNDCDGSTGNPSVYTSPADTNSQSGTGYFRGGKFAATTTTQLSSVAVDMTVASGSALRFGVYEATTENGSYTLIANASTTASTSARAWHASGALGVTITAGRWYAVGVNTAVSATYYYAASASAVFPYATAFGSHIGGASANTFGSALTTPYSFSTSTTSYNVRVTAGTVDESDADGDGGLACANDCDDNDGLVYVGAPELCDGLDNDCNNVVPGDEGDGDGDGALTCDDCNDGAATIYPGAPELCDGLDNDCDGLGDGVDVDGDLTLACNDCDDNNAQSYPGAVELCDGEDNDCDGDLGTGGGTGAPVTYTWDGGTLFTGTDRWRGNQYLATSNTTITQLAMEGGGTGTTFQVYESLTSAGTYTRLANAACGSTVSGWATSVTMNVPIVSGRYYYIGAGWTSQSYAYYNGTLLSTQNPTWGDHLGGGTATGIPGTSTTGIAFASTPYSGRVVSVDGGGNDEVDVDGDGWFLCEECDDDNASVTPGGAELCNGLDDNCDVVVPTNELDGDGDGQRPCAGDCNDGAVAIYLGATELCDGLDNDCNNVVPANEGDGDSDGSLTCADCNDGAATVYPGATEACDGLDNDCNSAVPLTEVDNDGDGLNECAGLDCDDGDALQYPGASEACNGADDDCNGSVPSNETDGDFDGQRVCAGDCNDGNAATYVGAPEICDAQDNNCDGAVPFTETDADGDGSPTCANDCDDNDPLTYPGAQEQCDGVDNDCNGAVPASENDGDADSYRVCAGDCNDGLASINPGATEDCNGLDDDCNGSADADVGGEVDLDGDGARSCEDCDDVDANAFPGNEEECDGADNDCDGTANFDDAGEADEDDDGWLSCAECDDNNEETFPGAAEICDREDNDCDGEIPGDESDDDGDDMTPCEGDCDDDEATTYDGAPEICDQLDNDCDGTAEDENEDEDGDELTPCDGDCDDTNAASHPDADEICDGEDNDCDGELPDDEVDLDDDGYSECAGDCDDEEALANPGWTEDTEEACNDNIDNDCDGDRDRREDDCDGLWNGNPDDEEPPVERACNCDTTASSPRSLSWLLVSGAALLARRRRP